MGCAAGVASRRVMDSVVSNRSSAASTRSAGSKSSKASKGSNLSGSLLKGRLAAARASSAFQAGARAAGEPDLAAPEAKVSVECLQKEITIGVILEDEDEEEFEEAVIYPKQLDHSLDDFSHPFCPVHQAT